MAKRKQEAKQDKEAERYLADYKGMVRQLTILSRIAARQLLGTRADEDPRLEYVAALESFKNLSNVQTSVLIRLVTEKLGVKREEFLELSREELAKQIEAMEQDLCVTGWDSSGNPVFNLQAYRERTAGWPP